MSFCPKCGADHSAEPRMTLQELAAALDAHGVTIQQIGQALRGLEEPDDEEPLPDRSH